MLVKMMNVKQVPKMKKNRMLGQYIKLMEQKIFTNQGGEIGQVVPYQELILS